MLATPTRSSGLFLWGLLLVSMGVFIFSKQITFAVNTSASVPYRFFMVIKGKALSKGDYASFYAPGNGRYCDETLFTKQVAGIAGDLVTASNKTIWINEQKIGQVLERDSKGHFLSASSTGEIPVGFYFMAGIHEKSFDSRYQAMGFIPTAAIVGRAYPLF